MTSQRMRVDAHQIAAAAAAAGKIPPWRVGYWEARIEAGGQAGAQAVTELVEASAAPSDVLASWRRGPQAAARSPADPDDPEGIIERLWPTEPGAGHGREPDRLRQLEERLPPRASARPKLADPVAAGIARRAWDAKARPRVGDMPDDAIFAMLFEPGET